MTQVVANRAIRVTISSTFLSILSFLAVFDVIVFNNSELLYISLF